MPNQSAPITKEKIIGKKLTLFIYFPKTGRVNERHLRRLLFGWKDLRKLRTRSWKGYSYKSTVSVKKDMTEYEYRGILSDIFFWRPFIKKSIFFVERKDAKKVASFFEELGVQYIQGNIVLTKIKI